MRRHSRHGATVEAGGIRQRIPPAFDSRGGGLENIGRARPSPSLKVESSVRLTERSTAQHIGKFERIAFSTASHEVDTSTINRREGETLRSVLLQDKGRGKTTDRLAATFFSMSVLLGWQNRLFRVCRYQAPVRQEYPTY